MKNRYVILSYVLIAAIAIVSANPNILSYDNGRWYNDRNQERTTEMNLPNATWNTISYPTPWVVEITNPLLDYNIEQHTYHSGETISIQKGTDTITITADVTTTLTVIP